MLMPILGLRALLSNSAQISIAKYLGVPSIILSKFALLLREWALAPARTGTLENYVGQAAINFLVRKHSRIAISCPSVVLFLFGIQLFGLKNGYFLSVIHLSVCGDDCNPTSAPVFLPIMLANSWVPWNIERRLRSKAPGRIERRYFLPTASIITSRIAFNPISPSKSVFLKRNGGVWRLSFPHPTRAAAHTWIELSGTSVRSGQLTAGLKTWKHIY